MSIQAIQKGFEDYWKVATGASLVTTAVKLIWGNVASLFFAATFGAICYRYPDQIKQLNNLDLKGLSLAASVLILPFSGAFSFVTSGIVSLSIIASELASK